MTDEMQQVKEALVRVLGQDIWGEGYDDVCRALGLDVDKTDTGKMADALIASVRAETLREVRGKVLDLCDEDATALISASFVLTALDALAHPEARDGE